MGAGVWRTATATTHIISDLQTVYLAVLAVARAFAAESLTAVNGQHRYMQERREWTDLIRHGPPQLSADVTVLSSLSGGVRPFRRQPSQYGARTTALQLGTAIALAPRRPLA